MMFVCNEAIELDVIEKPATSGFIWGRGSD